MTLGYVECFSGASGNMLLGALFDAGLDSEAWRQGIGALDLGPYQLRLERVTRHGLSGTLFEVELPERSDASDEAVHSDRHLSDIEGLIHRSGLSERVRTGSISVFRRLARAEARMHGSTVDEVHFHEVGAVDSIIDIVGFALGLEMLGIEQLHSSSATVGSGHVWTQHGLLPAPAPATVEILREAQVPVRRHPKADTEILTPTGAALLAELATFSAPAMVIDRVGYGFGTREFPWANALRISIGHADEAQADQAALLACNLDNASGEALGYLMERALEAGALDVWFTPIQMKKSRPAVEVSLLVTLEDADRLSRLLLRETPTLGVRRSVWQRTKAARRLVEVATPWGPVRVKEKLLAGDVVSASPEYEDCARLARAAGVPLDHVQREALVAWRLLQQGPPPSGARV